MRTGAEDEASLETEGISCMLGSRKAERCCQRYCQRLGTANAASLASAEEATVVAQIHL